MNRRFSIPVGLIFGLLAGCGGHSGQPPDAAAKQDARPSPPGVVVLSPGSPKLQQIRVATVKTAEAPTEEVVAPGKIQANPNRVSHVVLPLAGRIADVMVKLGDAVRQGQPLLSVDSPDAEAAQSSYLQAQAGVTQAQVALLKAQADLDRSRDLYQHKAVAQKEVLNAESALAQAKAGLEQAKAAEEQALRRLQILGLKPGDFQQKVVVTAPISGKVLEINVAAGEYRNDTNAPLMTIADLSTVWVASNVPESMIRFIHAGEQVDIGLTSYPDETFRARVTRISDTVDPQTRTVTVWAELNNAQGRFRPEMFGQIRHVESTSTMPVIPAGAVIQSEGTATVYRETGPGRFEPVPVSLGNRMGDFYAVTKGLQAGDRVVVDGAMLLKQL